MHDRPLPDWTFFISLNATVALLITASKAGAMFSIGSCFSQSKWLHYRKSTRKLEELDLFEEASRGPLGALVMLFTSWIWIKPLLLIGSIATVLALGVDTFGQLLVNIDSSRDIEIQDGRASFGFTHKYDSGVASQFPDVEGGGLMANTSTLDTTMQGAIYKALFDVNAQSVFNCTSRCVWKQTYVTLGFATNCTDVTAETHVTIRMDNNTGMGQWFNMSTPGNITLRAGYSPTSWLTLAQVAAVDLLDRFSMGTPIENLPISSEFARIAVLTAAVDQAGDTDTVSDIYPEGWKVSECTVGLAAYEYSNISASGNQFRIGNTTTIPLTSGQLKSTMLTFSQSNIPNMTVQGIDLAGLNAFFTSSRFSGSTYSGESRPSESTGMGDVMRKGDVPTLFKNMADSMTEQLRSGYNITAEGFTVESVVFVQVRWQWLSLPVFVLVAAACQLGYTMVSCQIDQRPLWKSSVVAVLFHEISGGGRPKQVVRTNLQSKKQLKVLARKTWVTVET
ncbi:hypothetical protein G7054_g953 [Neopestalotiopsis clavispora]|nr:hypothetical protein G7054_g953 [Neopestalotiopsis clavispora]